MLRIYWDSLEIIRTLVPTIERIARHDANLASQLRRALSSVPLNIAEGAGARGGNRTLRYESAVGSMREAMAALDTACAFSYLPALDPAVVARMNAVVGTLVRNVRARR